MPSQFEKRSTHKVAGSVLTKTREMLISFLCRLVSLYSAGSKSIGWAFLSLSNRKIYDGSDIYEDFMLYAPDIGAFRAA